MLEILFARMLDKLGAGVVAADPNGPVLADNAGRKGRECHGRAQTCTYGLQGGGGAAEHGGVVAAGGTSILEVQRRMTCGAYVQVGAGAWGAEGSVDSPGMLLLRSYGCLFLVLIWLVRNSLGGGGLPGIWQSLLHVTPFLFCVIMRVLFFHGMFACTTCHSVAFPTQAC